MQSSGKRTGVAGMAFSVGRRGVGVSQIRSAMRAHNARVARRATRGRLRRRNRITAGFLGIEVKYFDTGKVDTALIAPTDTTSFLFNPGVVGDCINCVAQGDGSQNRDGKKIKMRSLYIKGYLRRAPFEANGGVPIPVRAYVAAVIDRQTNGAAAASSLVWNQAPNGASALFNAGLMRNLEYSDRFRILRDQVFDLNLGTLAGIGTADAWSTQGIVRHFEWFIPLNDEVLFVNTSPTVSQIANIVTNAINFYAVATDATAVLGAVTCGYVSRLRFVG